MSGVILYIVRPSHFVVNSCSTFAMQNANALHMQFSHHTHVKTVPTDDDHRCPTCPQLSAYNLVS